MAVKQQQAVVEGITLYANALKQHRLKQTNDTAQFIDIQEGYRSGLIGKITQIHAEFYFEHANFGEFFEKK